MLKWFTQYNTSYTVHAKNYPKKHKNTTQRTAIQKRKRKTRKPSEQSASRFQLLENRNAQPARNESESNLLQLKLGSVQSINTSVTNSSVCRAAVGSSSRVALSAFCYEIDSDELDVAISKLRGIDLDVEAVWVVSRPITGPNNNTIFEHWAVKIYNEMVLVDLDFYEMSGVGAFGCAPVCASWTELSDFLHYYRHDGEVMVKERWDVIAHAVPTKPPRNRRSESASSTSSDSGNGIVSMPMSRRSIPIRCSKKISDICDFLDDWSERKQSYHSVLNNCQRFAFDLFRFLVGDAYPMRVDKLKQKLQSPYDHICVTSPR